MHKEIAKIRRAYFGIEDHGILACYLDFDFGGSGQGTGGDALDEPVHDDEGKFLRREGTAYGMQFLAAVMRAAGVESWDKVQGRTVFALRDREGWGGTIVGIAPLPTEPGEEFIFAREALRRGRIVTAAWNDPVEPTMLRGHSARHYVGGEVAPWWQDGGSHHSVCGLVSGSPVSTDESLPLCQRCGRLARLKRERESCV